MILFELIADRTREIREFILLTWPEKKKRARQFWDKYGRLYILLFILATVVAFINVYMETNGTARTNSRSQLGGEGGTARTNSRSQLGGEGGTARTNSRSQLGGDDTKPLAQTTSSNNTLLAEPGTQQAKNNNPSTTTSQETGAADNKSKKNNNAASETTDTKNQQSKNTINITTQVSTTLPSINTAKTSKDRVSEIKERRKEKQQQRAKQSSFQQSISSLGTNLTTGISDGTGRALSVLGTFFSAILGLLLFCCAPVVIFYMWMKKLIMPLFPVSTNNNN